MGLSKTSRFWLLTLTPEEFTGLKRAIGATTNLDEIRDMVGHANAEILFDLGELLESVVATY